MGWWDDLKNGAQKGVDRAVQQAQNPFETAKGMVTEPWKHGGLGVGSMGNVNQNWQDTGIFKDSTWSHPFEGARQTLNAESPFFGVLSSLSPTHNAMNAWQTEKEEAPTYEQYKGFNPDEYKGFDNSAISQNMQRDVASGAAMRRQQQLAQLSKMGVRGADSTSAMSRIGADQERAMQAIQAGLARQNYEDAWRQYMAGHDDWNAGQDRKLQAWQAKQQKAQDSKNSSMQMLGNVAGMYFGGKK